MMRLYYLEHVNLIIKLKLNRFQIFTPFENLKHNSYKTLFWYSKDVKNVGLHPI